ncbi:MAG TPA: hypothetical protein VM871_00420 [Flavisolibacter sp.]|jgi:hypothetical protein|nr:hypothetical protein [Flavisolibacter sp.]
MMLKEVVLVIACFLSFVFLFLSFDAIEQYDKKIGMSTAQKRNLYLITFVVPLYGFIVTRRLIRGLL